MSDEVDQEYEQQHAQDYEGDGQVGQDLFTNNHDLIGVQGIIRA